MPALADRRRARTGSRCGPRGCLRPRDGDSLPPLSARTSRLLLAVVLVVFVGVVGIFAFAGADPGGPQPRRQRGMDLIHYWVAGTLLDGGAAAQLYDAERYKPEYQALYPERPPRYPVGYPPPIYQLFALPQPALAYVVGAKLLLGLLAGLHLVGSGLVVAAAHVARERREAALAMAIGLPGAVSSVMSGQLAGLWVLSLGGGWWLRSRGRPGAAGLALALLWMKPTLAVPVGAAFLLLGELRLLGGLVLGGAAVLAASLAAPGGVEAWAAYLGRLSDPGDLLGDFWIFWHRQATLRTLVAGLAPSKAAAIGFGWVGAALGVAAAVAIARRSPAANAGSSDLHAGAVLSWCLLAAPHLLEYDLGLHLFGMVASAAWLAAGRARFPRAGAGAIAFAWGAGAYVLVNRSAHVNLTALAVLLWAVWMAVEVELAARAAGPGALGVGA